MQGAGTLTWIILSAAGPKPGKLSAAALPRMTRRNPPKNLADLANSNKVRRSTSLRTEIIC